MKLIGENLHIISKSVSEALKNRDEVFVKDIIKKQNNLVEYIDLNIGPAKAGFENLFPWLIKLVKENSNLKLSLDTTNANEMKKGLEAASITKNVLINSASDDVERLESMSDLAAEYETDLIALTLNNKKGIPSTADDRFELALDMYETFMEKGITNERIYFDPLVLPIKAAQNQAVETLNAIKILKESFEPFCNTVIGLSNISNGSAREVRPLLNKVYLAFAFGAGLDAVILNAFDEELLRVVKMLETNIPVCESDKLLLDLTTVISDFTDLSDIKYNINDKKSSDIYKAAEVLLNKKIYSDSFTQV